MADMGSLMLLDTASLYFRAFYGVPDTVRAPDGAPAQIRIAAKTAVNAADDVGCMSDQGPMPTL